MLLKPNEVPQAFQRARALQRAGRADEALALYTQILMVRPKTPEALFQIGQIHATAGQRDKAAASLRKALALKPKEQAIWALLHRVLAGPERAALAAEAAQAGIALAADPTAALMAKIEAGQAAEAEAAAKAALARAPQDPALNHVLGLARLRQGRAAEALAPLELAAAAAPSTDLVRLIGEVHAQLGHVTQAEPALTQALDAGAEAAAAPLARLMVATGRPEAALPLYDRALSAQPDQAALWRDRAWLLAELGRPDAARASAARAVKAGAHPLAIADALASRLAEEGARQAASDVLAAALKSAPEAPALLLRRAQLSQSDGDLTSARADLRRAIARDPVGGELYRAYAAGTTITEDDPILPAMTEALARTDLPPGARQRLHFALAKAMEDLGRHDEVFAHLHTGNRLQQQAYPYGFEADLAAAQAMVAGHRAQRDGGGASAADPGAQGRVIFVTGLPRSGTTLVETILAAHGDVTPGGEMGFLNRALAQVFDWQGRDAAPPPGALAEAGTRYLAMARRRTGVVPGSGGPQIFTDKAISTFSRIGPAARILPQAQFVLVRRNPRDLALSAYRNMFPDGLHRYTSDLVALGRFIRLFEALAEAWAALVPDRVTVVDYEALTAAPQDEIPRLIAAVGLPWDPACLEPQKADRRIETLSFVQARQPINQRSVEGWRRYAAELAPLETGLATKIDLGL